MKKQKLWVTALVVLICTIGIICILRTAVVPSTSVVSLDSDQSWLRGFYVMDSTVKIKCRLFIENQSDHDTSVMIVGQFSADQKAGLLQESQLLGCAEEYPYGTVFTVPSGGAWFNVDFIGTHGGTNRKQNRLIPEIQLIVVQQPLAEKAQETVPRTVAFEETLAFTSDSTEVTVDVSISPDSAEVFGVSAYVGSGGLLGTDAQAKILTTCQPMPIDSTAKLKAYLQAVYPVLTEAGYLAECDLPCGIQIYTNDMMFIRFCNNNSTESPQSVCTTEFYISLENGTVLGVAKSTMDNS